MMMMIIIIIMMMMMMIIMMMMMMMIIIIIIIIINRGHVAYAAYRAAPSAMLQLSLSLLHRPSNLRAP
jgi:hypothetical protein